MEEKLDRIERRFEAIEAELSASETYRDPERVVRLNREKAELEPAVTAWRAYSACRKELGELESLSGEGDEELAALIKGETRAARDRLAHLEGQLRDLLRPGDPNDGRAVIVEVRAGVGGEEAALFARSLFRMYTMYSERHGWTSETISANETELGGVKEICFRIEGGGAWSGFKYESGVHRVQRVPETESGGRVHTSTATVAVLPEVDEVTLQLDPADLQIDTFRSSGAGGQHINKTESAIRVTHLPTGMVVECQDERSQYKNKERALQVLRARLYDRMQQEQAQALSQERRGQIGSGMRNERIRTYNFPQGRVTDHRIGLTVYRIDDVMNGDLDEIVAALAAADQAARLNGEDPARE